MMEKLCELQPGFSTPKPWQETWELLPWMCIACHVTSGYLQPEEVAEIFFFAYKARIKGAKYEEQPVDRLPPSTRLRELTNNDGTSTLQGFYHPVCPIYAADSNIYK